jgi:hypothetical protein
MIAIRFFGKAATFPVATETKNLSENRNASQDKLGWQR